jgi:hypothetical protein
MPALMPEPSSIAPITQGAALRLVATRPPGFFPVTRMQEEP